MEFSATVILAGLIVALLWLFTVKNGKKHRLPPGPRGLPFIGNLQQIDKKKPIESFRKIFGMGRKGMEEWIQEESQHLRALICSFKGKPSCVGESLAHMELFLFMVSLLQGFTFSCPDGPDGINLVPEYRSFANLPHRYDIIATPR